MFRKIVLFGLFGALAVQASRADVTVLEKRTFLGKLSEQQKKAHAARNGDSAKGALPLKATGSQALTDSGTLEYFINTNITFSTSSSASGAESEASFTGPVAATTSGGGTVSTTLNDSFDGYNSLCISGTNTFVPCTTGGGRGKGNKGAAGVTMYNDNGPATVECNGRQVVLNPQVIGSITVQRKIFVPANDQFSRWMNIFTNTSGTSQTVTMVTGNNLGSDANTRVVSSSSGNAAAETSDSWVTTFQNYSGTTSSDPRLGHIFQQAGAPVQLAGISFADGDDNPFWGYTFTLAPNETKIILNYVTGQPSKAAAASKAAEIAGFPDSAKQCMSSTELAQTSNFVALSLIEVPTLGQTGLVALGLLVAASAFFVLRRRARAAA